MVCSLPGSSVYGIFSARNTEVDLSFPPPGDLLDPGIEPMSPASPALAGEFFTIEPRGNTLLCMNAMFIWQPLILIFWSGFTFWKIMYSDKDCCNLHMFLLWNDFFKNFVCLFIVVALGLCCCEPPFSSCGERGYSLYWCTGFSM